MALSNAEKVRRYRERQKKKAADRNAAADEYLKTPFSEWMDDNRWSELQTYLEWAGVAEPPDYAAAKDTDPEWEPIDGTNRKSIGRAERIVACLLDGAQLMASFINRYKLEEIERRILEIERSDLSDPTTKAQALKDIAVLSRFRDELTKEARWRLPQWRLTGE